MPAAKRTISLPTDLDEMVAAYEIPVSATCQEALRAAVERVEGDRRKIVVQTATRREGWAGRWLLLPGSDEALTELAKYRGPDERTWPAGHYAVGVTLKGRIAVFYEEGRELKFYPTLSDAAPFLPEDVLERVEPAARVPEADPIFWHDE